MNRRIFQFAIILLWLALPLTAYLYRQVWNQLPAHVATHFDATGRANGWMSRSQALGFAVGFMAFLLIVFTPLMLYRSRSRVDAFYWAMLAFCYLVIGSMVEVNRGLIAYNLQGAAIPMGATLIAVPVAAVFLIGIYVASRREPPLPHVINTPTDLVAEETHAGRPVVLLFLPAVFGPLIAAIVVPVTAVRIAMSVVVLMSLAIIVAAWSGFRYRFFRHGFEISALAFRLRSIPRNQIQSYAPENWSMWRGYGIRGVGNSRAYVWGNKVVHIRTSNGDVFLGHNDPQRVMHDLDRLTSSVSGQGMFSAVEKGGTSRVGDATAGLGKGTTPVVPKDSQAKQRL
jgi:Protein of unknown function (DUF1648)